MKRTLSFFLILAFINVCAFAGSGGPGTGNSSTATQTTNTTSKTYVQQGNPMVNLTVYENTTYDMNNPNWKQSFSGSLSLSNFSIKGVDGVYRTVNDGQGVLSDGGFGEWWIQNTAWAGGSMITVTDSTDDVVKIDTAGNNGNCYTDPGFNCNTMGSVNVTINATDPKLHSSKTATSSTSATGSYTVSTLSGLNVTFTNGNISYVLNKTTNEYYVDVTNLTNVVAWTPIILDLSGTGIPDVSRQNYLPHAPAFYTEKMALFDMMGTGVPVLTEWVGPNAGILVVPDKDGSVTSGMQMFGKAGGWSDGYEKLATLYDPNHTGIVSGDALKGMAVWIDKNGNGKVDPGELVSLDSLGITALSVQHKNYQSWYQLKNGSKQKMWDWWPSIKLLKKVNQDMIPMLTK